MDNKNKYPKILRAITPSTKFNNKKIIIFIKILKIFLFKIEPYPETDI